tara:strand:- start:2238 stop:3779 length:1542 start_codon:yes stop_codon:yes gene_type:complete
VETIFVQIAAYRDPELEATCFDLIVKAKHPDRINIGIVWQGIEPNDDRMIYFGKMFPQITVEHHDAATSQGVCWARARAQRLYKGEDYTLQIDSHMRFEEGWDEILINMLSECDSDKPLLTTYPPDYKPPNELIKTRLPKMRPKEFSPQGILLLTSNSIPIEEAPDYPIKGTVCAAGFIFGKAEYIQEVPYDPNIYFFGEEISLTVRLWTNGWDFYHPNKLVIYHLWSRDGRQTHSQDHKTTWWDVDKASKQRVRSMLGVDAEEVDIQHYGLGTVRSIEEYQKFSGIDFKNKEINTAAKGVFTNYYKNNAWGNSESRSGSGSTLEQTKNIRAEIKKLISKYNIKSVTDFPCGDLNWVQLLFGDIPQYTGCDIVQECIRNNSSRFPEHKFKCLDLSTDEIPQSDLLIVRDVIGHQPLETGMKMLENIKRSKCKYLLTTTWARKTPTGFDVPFEPCCSDIDAEPLTNKDVPFGGWYPVNLMASPFSLPLAKEFLQELPAGKTLGFWEISTLESKL